MIRDDVVDDRAQGKLFEGEITHTWIRFRNSQYIDSVHHRQLDPILVE